jgi:hypothetical protein
MDAPARVGPVQVHLNQSGVDYLFIFSVVQTDGNQTIAGKDLTAVPGRASLYGPGDDPLLGIDPTDSVP